MSEAQAMQILAEVRAMRAALDRLAGERLNGAQAAIVLGTSATTIRKMEADGRIPKRDITGRWTRSDLIIVVILRPEADEVEVSKPPEPIAYGEVGHHLYRHFDKDGKLLYIGISYNALVRLQGHEKGSSQWFNHIAKVEMQVYKSKEDAVLAERIAIKKERPAHNVIHNR